MYWGHACAFLFAIGALGMKRMCVGKSCHGIGLLSTLILMFALHCIRLQVLHSRLVGG